MRDQMRTIKRTNGGSSANQTPARCLWRLPSEAAHEKEAGRRGGRKIQRYDALRLRRNKPRSRGGKTWQFCSIRGEKEVWPFVYNDPRVRLIGQPIRLNSARLKYERARGVSGTRETRANVQRTSRF